MRLVDNVTLALRRLRHRPMRSLLLLQGTIWGVAVSLFPTAVMEGSRLAALERGAEIGADRVTIAADPTAVDATGLDAADVEAIRVALERDGIPAIAVAGVSVRLAKAATASGDRGVDWILGPPDAPVARGLTLSAGRPVDPKAAVPEAVVEGILAEELSRDRGSAGALGASLLLPDGRTAVVVGAAAPRPPPQRRSNDMGFDTGHRVFRGVTGKFLLSMGVPLGDDGWKRTDRCAYAAPADGAVDWIYVRVPSTLVRAAKKAAERALLDRGKACVLFHPIAFPLLLANELDRFRTVNLALFLACLVMGAVVMANVGLLAALRRAPEVALHRTEGATKADVATQFLAEGGILAVFGTLIGWAVGCGLAELRVALEPAVGLTWAFPWSEALIALAVALVAGVLACVLPAMRAAANDPVQGLADE